MQRIYDPGYLDSIDRFPQRLPMYTVILTPDDNGTFLVTCPDLPEVATFGEDAEDVSIGAQKGPRIGVQKGPPVATVMVFEVGGRAGAEPQA
jgi:hypothetical protein